MKVEEVKLEIPLSIVEDVFSAICNAETNAMLLQGLAMAANNKDDCRESEAIQCMYGKDLAELERLRMYFGKHRI
jgi:hypothetical protein